MNSIVETLEAKLLEPFETLAQTLTFQFHSILVQAYSYPIGSATNLQGHTIGIECMFTDAPPDATDNVALGVDLAYLTTRPRISASVEWGHPSGYLEAGFGLGSSSLDWSEVSDEWLESLYASLPSLIEAFTECVKRRKPGNE